MNEWKPAKLSDTAYIIMGQSPAGETCNTDNGIPLLNGPTEFTAKSPLPVQYTTDPKKLSKVGDILFCVRGSTTGRMNWSDQVYAIGRGIAAIRHKYSYKANCFIKAILDYHLEEILAVATGSTFPNVSKSDIENLEINLPPLPEQEAIAEVLSSLDDKIDLLHRNNKTLEQMAETLFRQWFVEEAEEDWEEAQLENYIDVVRGLSYKGSGLSNNTNLRAIPMINLNSIFEGGGYKKSGIKYYDGPYREKHLVYPGELIVTNTEQGHEHKLIGFSAIVPTYVGDKAIFSHHIYKVIPKSSRVTPIFLHHLLKTSSVREQVAGSTNGSTINMLPIDGLLWCYVKLPPQHLVDKFASITLDIQTKKEQNEIQIESLENIRDLILSKLMSGAVIVSDL